VFGRGAKICWRIFLIGEGPPLPLGLMCFQELTRGSSPAVPMILFGLGGFLCFQYFSGDPVWMAEPGGSAILEIATLFVRFDVFSCADSRL
jgi:hypothetical protein